MDDKTKISPIQISITDPSTIELKMYRAEVSKYFCSACNINFAVETRLINHKIRFHDSKIKYRECDKCKFRTTKNKKLMKHLQTHSEVKPHQCPVCNLQFNTRVRKKRHMKLHSMDHVCNYCDRKFPDNCHLIIHINRQHTKEKPYQCTECDKRFVTKFTLNTHSKMHSGERHYECTECDSKFVHPSTLSRHMKVHKGDTPYHCTVCDSKFNGKTALGFHLRVHFDQELHTCTICYSKFSRTHLLQDHMTKHRENETGL